MASQCNLTWAAQIWKAKHPRNCHGLYNQHLTPQNPVATLFLPRGLPHKNVDESLSRKRAHTFNVMQDFLPSASSQPIRGSC
jgi:hypothetical protein